MSQLSPVINVTALPSRTDNDRESMDGLPAIFSGELPPVMQTLARAVAKVDRKRMETASYTLAGMLANLSTSHLQTSR